MRMHWFRISPFSAKSLRLITEGMSEQAFTTDQGRGFLLDEVRMDRLRGRYVRIFPKEEVYKDPFGNEQLLKYNVFETVNLVMRTTEPNLLVINPPRSLGELFTTLGEILEHSVSIVPVIRPIDLWISAINDCNATVRIVAVNTKKVTIDRNATVKAQIEGASDVSKAIVKFFGSKDVPLQTVTGYFIFSGVEFKFRLSEKGFTFSKEPSKEIFGVLNDIVGRLCEA